MKNLPVNFALALSLFLCSLSVPRVQAEETGLTPEMVVDLNTVSGVALDPRGELLVYTLSVQRSPDDEHGRRYSELWVVGSRVGEPRQFTASQGNVSAPAWSPDGTKITFLAKRKQHHEETQIYQISRDGGEAGLLTRHDASISLYRWSPDGKTLAFVDRQSETKDEKENSEKGRDWKVFGEGEKERRLWLFDVAMGEAKIPRLQKRDPTRNRPPIPVTTIPQSRSPTHSSNT